MTSAAPVTSREGAVGGPSAVHPRSAADSRHPSSAASHLLRVSPSDLRALHIPWSALLRNKLKEYRIKASGNRIKGQGMIGADAKFVRDTFGSLKGDDFFEYNLPQQWVERRQIPRAIDGHVPVKSAFVLDLGCGPGTSTHVLAHFADPSWTILGYDFTDHLIADARARAQRAGFHNKHGQVIIPEFYCQDIAQPLLRGGHTLPDACADFAVSGGVVGLYMHEPGARALFRQLARILKPGAFAAIDAGPSIPAPRLRRLAEDEGFVHVATCKSFIIEPRPKLVFQTRS